jgi:hypothetical protein
MNNSWMNNPNVLAQFGHAGIPYGMLLTLDKFHHNLLFWVVALGILAYAPIKEFWYDANYETPKQPFKNNLIDFSFYCLGVGLAILVHKV